MKCASILLLCSPLLCIHHCYYYLLFRKGENPRTPCREQTAYEHIQPMWDWVKHAKYNITEEYEHHKIDIYVYKVS